MNENFVKHLLSSNKTVYELASRAGLPYTTINRLANGKLDINNISSEALYRISIILGIPMQELLNPIRIVNNASGHCGKTKYKWTAEGDKTAKITFMYKKEPVTIDMEYTFNNPKERKYYDYFAQMAIERYIKRRKFEESILDAFGEESACKDII